MKPITFHRAFLKIFTLMILCFTAFSFTTKLGLDRYEIYLNNKLVLQQSVNQPVNLRVLPLARAKAGDELRITYRHCHSPESGTGRSITLKDEEGNTLKTWTFADVTGSDVSMVIAVKELLQLEKNSTHHPLSLHYTARELSKGETLAFLRLK
jgi:hypothetical protein